MDCPVSSTHGNTAVRKTYSAKQLRNKTGRSGSFGSYVPLSTHILNHPRFTALPMRAKTLFLALAGQLRYGGKGWKNNGDLSATISLMKRHGFGSSATLQKAKQDLLDNEVIIETRKGGKNRCSLYALSMFPINECDGKLEVRPTSRAPVCWSLLTSKPKNEILASESESEQSQTLH